MVLAIATIGKVNDAKEDVLADGIQTFPDRTDRVYLNPEACSVIRDDALNPVSTLSTTTT